MQENCITKHLGTYSHLLFKLKENFPDKIENHFAANKKTNIIISW